MTCIAVAICNKHLAFDLKWRIERKTFDKVIIFDEGKVIYMLVPKQLFLLTRCLQVNISISLCYPPLNDFFFLYVCFLLAGWNYFLVCFNHKSLMHVDNRSRHRCSKFNLQGHGTKWLFGNRVEKNICLKAQIVQKMFTLIESCRKEHGVGKNQLYR